MVLKSHARPVPYPETKTGGLFTVAAKIEGGTLRAHCEPEWKPNYVRYAWANNPVAVLYNKENLPASPFRLKLDGAEGEKA